MTFIDTLIRNLNADRATARSFDATLAATSAGRGHYGYALGTAGPIPSEYTHSVQVFDARGRLLGTAVLSHSDGIWR